MAKPPAEKLLERIESKTARVCVIGLGYVGLPLVETFVNAGYRVLGFDIDPHKVEQLMHGQSYIGHIPSERIGAMLGDRRFLATCDAAEFTGADVLIICVPTPLTSAREPDLTYIVETGKCICPRLQPGQLVILESTTYPGTTEDLLCPILEKSGLRAGLDFFLAFSPEREDPGNPLFSTRVIPKVVGGWDAVSGRLAEELYKRVVEKVVPVSSARVAEACKILENTYRAVNIALVNELKIVFDAMGFDIWEVIRAAQTKPFGFQAFYPGPGLGGHCIPIDPFYLTWAARKAGVHTRFIELAGEVNAGMPRYVVERVAGALNDDGKPVKNSRICVLGVAYKKNVDDPRESPAFPIMKMLRERGAIVNYHDPYVPRLPFMRHHDIHLDSQKLSEEFISEQDCILIVTDHSCLDYAWIAKHGRLIVDTRNATAGMMGRIVKA